MGLGAIKEYARLMRLKAMGISTIAVFGALSVTGSLEIWHFLCLFLIGIPFNILGFVLNDINDLEIDKKSKELSERPLVKGTVSIRSAKIVSIICVVLIFSLTIFFFRDLFVLLILTISVFLGMVYDFWGKRFLGSDFILAASIALFCFFGALTVTHRIEKFTLIIVPLIFIHVLFFNMIEGGFKDAKNDKESGAKTIAVALGITTDSKFFIPKSFRIIAIIVELSAAFLVFLPFVLFPEMYHFEYWYIQLIILILLTMSLVRTMVTMLNMKFFDRVNVRNIITKQEIKRNIVTVVLLISVAGVFWSIVLVLIPILWYLFFSFFLFEKPFIPSKML
jgi:4-hydroxybenzoate polyprenyltransferase